MRFWLILLAIAAFAQELPLLKRMPDPPTQPLPFSHKRHVTINGLKCAECHPMPDNGELATIAKTAKCMTCHASVKTDSEWIRKLAKFHADSGEVPWRQVYRIPNWVSFSHKQHVEKAGAGCESCHGKVGEKEVLQKERDLSMAACMDCHRVKKASLGCNFCHDPR